MCKEGHLIDGDNAAPISGGGVICRICRNAKDRERYRKQAGAKSSYRNAKKTPCVHGHLYDEENTYVTPAGRLQCKACRRVRVMESWWRHREKRLAENKEWCRQNPERLRENLRRWGQENKDRVNLLSRLKKQRRRAAGNLTVADWELVLETYGAACLNCGKPNVTIDHVVPVSKGGANTIDNVQPLCSFCNTSKATKTIDYRPFPIAALTG